MFKFHNLQKFVDVQNVKIPEPRSLQNRYYDKWIKRITWVTGYESVICISAAEYNYFETIASVKSFTIACTDVIDDGGTRLVAFRLVHILDIQYHIHNYSSY